MTTWRTPAAPSTTTWAARTPAVTPWGAPVSPTTPWNAMLAASTAWVDNPLGFPDIWDGGLAQQVQAYADQVDGGGAVVSALADLVSGVAPYSTEWTRVAAA